jgi:hypothetical protein
MVNRTHLTIQLTQISRSRIRLTVRNNGCGQPVPISQRRPQIGHDLATLMEAELDYGMPGFDGTVAQIEFPV